MEMEMEDTQTHSIAPLPSALVRARQAHRLERCLCGEYGEGMTLKALMGSWVNCGVIPVHTYKQNMANYQTRVEAINRD
jgi:hypothetical protein